MRTPFTEAVFWKEVGAGWNRLYGHFSEMGISFEWHDFIAPERFNWSKSFHAASLELCLNLAGRGEVSCGKKSAEYTSGVAGFYSQDRTPLAASRKTGERHQFISVEFAPSFLSRHLSGKTPLLHPLVQSALKRDVDYSGVSEVTPLSVRQQLIVGSLRAPPVLAAAQPLWYECKAVELMVEFFFKPSDQNEMFCTRQERVGIERVEKVKNLLSSRLVDPPSLEELGRLVGCSPFYLSRTFSKEVGLTIPQYLRQIRMEKAAEFLRGGSHNVTEAAFAVGYSSLSHFSHAFHQTFGCCPGLYPLKIGSLIPGKPPSE